MTKRIWYDWNIINHHKNFPVKQIYARIYIKSKKSIIIVSKDWNDRQMPWWKPENWENIFETLQREIYEETSLKLNLNSKDIPILFWYYQIQENWEKYLQLRYFIEIENIDEKLLKPNEKWDIDCIKYLKLVDINEISKIIPRLSNSEELDWFMKNLNESIIERFIIQHKSEDKIAERLSIFESVRDFLYQINWANTPEKLLEIKEWYCVSKHRLLQAIYNRLWYETKLCFIPFSFDMVYLPDSLKNWWYANKKWYHVFLKINIDWNWINIDSTFNSELKDSYVVNENWDWISSQKIICSYDKVYIPNSSDEEREIKKLLSDPNGMRNEDYEWIEKFNNWIRLLKEQLKFCIR